MLTRKVRPRCTLNARGRIGGRGAGDDRQAVPTVVVTDRNLVNVLAARRTVEANQLRNVVAHFSNGVCGLSSPGEPVDCVVIRLPKGRLPLLQLLWDGFHALRVGGACFVTGANREGIKPAIGLMGQLFGNATIVGVQEADIGLPGCGKEDCVTR